MDGRSKATHPQFEVLWLSYRRTGISHVEAHGGCTRFQCECTCRNQTLDGERV